MKNNSNGGNFHRRNNGQGRGQGGQGQRRSVMRPGSGDGQPPKPGDGPQGFIGDGPGDGVENITFMIGAGFGVATRSPFVEVTIKKDGGEDMGPIRLPAEASIHDGFLIAFLVGQVGADLDMVSAVLHSFRDYRDDIFHGQMDDVLRSHGYTKGQGPGDPDPDPVPKA